MNNIDEANKLRDEPAPEHGKYLRLLLIAGTVILLDQLTKYIILKNFALHESLTVIPGLFDITHIHNPGGAFGFFSDQSPVVRKLVFRVFSVIAVFVVLYFYHQTPKHETWISCALALIFGGAIGNLIDRFRFGIVVDFLDFYIGNNHWPAFNVADSAITVGVTVFVVHLLFGKMPE